jgi:hypothetical protein
MRRTICRKDGRQNVRRCSCCHRRHWSEPRARQNDRRNVSARKDNGRQERAGRAGQRLAVVAGHARSQVSVGTCGSETGFLCCDAVVAGVAVARDRVIDRLVVAEERKVPKSRTIGTALLRLAIVGGVAWPQVAVGANGGNARQRRNNAVKALIRVASCGILP